MDLLSLDLSAPQTQSTMQPEQQQHQKSVPSNENSTKSWYDLFADLDPIGNPDSINNKSDNSKDSENRYC